jgi:hypothetical protein
MQTDRLDLIDDAVDDEEVSSEQQRDENANAWSKVGRKGRSLREQHAHALPDADAESTPSKTHTVTTYAQAAALVAMSADVSVRGNAMASASSAERSSSSPTHQQSTKQTTSNIDAMISQLATATAISADNAATATPWESLNNTNPTTNSITKVEHRVGVDADRDSHERSQIAHAATTVQTKVQHSLTSVVTPGVTPSKANTSSGRQQQSAAAKTASEQTPTDRRSVAAASATSTPVSGTAEPSSKDRRRKTPQIVLSPGAADYSPLKQVVTAPDEVAVQRLTMHRLVDSAIDSFMQSDFAHEVRSNDMPRELQQEAWMLLAHRITKMAMKLSEPTKTSAAPRRVSNE